MIAGSNAAENLLFVIETQRKGGDVLSAVRKELADLGIASKDMGAAMAGGAEAGISEVLKLSQTIDVTSKSDVQALRANATAMRELALAAGLAPEKIQQLNVAEQVLQSRLTAATQEARAQAAVLTGTANNIDKISPKARTAANAFTQVAFAATGMGSSIQGATIAAGTLVSSLASLSSSAAIVASASGLGAIIVVLGALIPLLRDAKVASDDLTDANRALGHIKTMGEAQGAVAGITQEIASTKAAVLKAESEMTGYVTGEQRKRRDQLKAHLESEQELLKAAKGKVMDVAYAEADERVRAAEAAHKGVLRVGDKAAHDREEQAKRIAAADAQALKLQQSLHDEAIQSFYTGQGRVQEAEEAAAAASRQRRIDDLEESIATAERKAFLLVDIENAYQARITQIRNQAANEADQRQQDEYDRKVAVEKKAAAKRVETAKNAVDAIVRTEGSVLKTLKRLALEPIVNELEGIAAREAVKALASFPDFAAMAAHGAAAIAATAAAREVASWEGGSSRGSSSSGGGAGSGGSNAGTFEPRTGTQGQGSLVINLITRNPYGREEIQQTMYELNRAGLLNRPAVQIPPTTGISSMAA